MTAYLIGPLIGAFISVIFNCFVNCAEESIEKMGQSDDKSKDIMKSQGDDEQNALTSIQAK